MNMESKLIGMMANQFIESMAEKVRQLLKAEGYHNWRLNEYELSYAAPNPSIFKLRVLLKNLLVKGADKIEAKNVKYNTTTTAINFEIFLPELVIRSGKSSIVVTLCDKEFDSRLSGRVIVKNLRLLCKSDLGFNESKEFQINITEAKLTVESILSEVQFSLLGMDFSQIVNTFMSVTLVEFIRLHGDKCKEILNLIKEQVTGPTRSPIHDMF